MLKKGVFYRGTEGFTPDDERALKLFVDMPHGTKTLMWVHKARYPEHNRFVFASLSEVANKIGTTVDALLIYVKRELAMFDFAMLPDGSVEKDWHSLSPESMSQAEFQKFWDETKALIKDRFDIDLDQSSVP